MEITAEQTQDVAVVDVSAAELDAANSLDFKRDIAPVLDAYAKVVFDLSKLRFIDSSGLSVFISCLRKLSEKGGDLKLCGVSTQVRAALALVRMDRILDIYGTREEATRAFLA